LSLILSLVKIKIQWEFVKVLNQLITINDIKINYQIRNGNAAKSIFVIHGWSLKGTENWQSFLDKLALNKPDYKILCVDLPGFGQSQPPTEKWGVNEYSKFVNDFLVKLDIFPDIIIAHSFGGAISMDYLKNLETQNIILTKTEGSLSKSEVQSLNSKENQRKLNPKVVLFAPAIVRPSSGFLKKIIQNIFSLGKNILLTLKLDKLYTKLRQILYKFYGSTDYLKSHKIMSEIFLKVISQDCTYLLDKIDNQTLLIWGDKDVQTPLWQSKIILSKLKNSKLVILENTRHAIHIQAEEKVLAEVENFI